MPVLQESIHPRFCAWEASCVAGLVAITPASGFVKPFPAILIGTVAGVVCYFMCSRRVLRSALRTPFTRRIVIRIGSFLLRTLCFRDIPQIDSNARPG